MSDDLRHRLSAALEGRYRIERELGAGGMATVWLAEDLKHDRKVAIKVLKPELTAVLGGDRFIQEIKTTAALSHPHILPLFDSGESDGFLYYVMPWLEGETVREKLSREKQLGIEEAVKIATGVADALDYAHRHGIIHRDIKPEDILLHDRRPVVVDFGIALAVSAAAGGRMTETGTSVGTPHYMSPEQATGDKQFTGRSDVYSLASVLYEMLTGSPPHVGSSAQQVIMKIIAEPVQPVTAQRKSVPPNVAAAVMKALEKLPADRFESAKAFSDALQDAAFRTPGAEASARIASRSRPGRLVVVTPVVVAALLAGGFAGWRLAKRDSAGNRMVSWSSITMQGGDDLAASTPNESITNRGRPRLTALALSPDGSTLVFAGNRNGVRQLFRRRFDDPEATPIEGTDGAEYPVFSPNGRTLLFWADSALRTVPLEGAPAVRLARVTQMLGASWGDDDRIIFRDGTLPGLRRVDASGTRVEVLPSAPDARLPHVLPGSRAVLYTSRLQGTDQDCIESLRLKDFARDTVLTDAADARYAATGHLAFERRGELMAVPFDAASGRPTGPAFGVLRDVMQALGGMNVVVNTGAAQYAISRNGHLAYLSGGTTRPSTIRIRWVDRTGQATDLPIPPRWYLTSRISPDGRRIAMSAPGRADGGVWVVDTDHPGNTRRLVNRPVAFLVWSPESDRIAFDDSAGLATVAVEGGVRPELVLAESVVPALWIDPDEILFLDRDSTGHLALGGVSVRTRERRSVLSEPDADITFPDISPDGRWIAYRLGPPAFDIVLRRWPSLADRHVIALARGQVAWARGPELLHLGGWATTAPVEQPGNDRDQARVTVEPAMISVRVDTAGHESGVPRELFRPGLASSEPVRSWDVTPDGQHFVWPILDPDDLGADPPAKEIHVVLNWFRVLQAAR